MFEPGRIYVRADVRRAWDGTTSLQRQGGILTPAEAPLIVVITGEAGQEFGYADYWERGSGLLSSI
jgi:5-methylcytosine-specific restriction enzyme A